MAYDEGLAERARRLIEEIPGFVEKKMFGGIGFMIDGNMACGVIDSDLIVRVGPESYADALASDAAREFDFTGRPMKGWVMVDPSGCDDDGDLAAWVKRGVDFARSLPSKA